MAKYQVEVEGNIEEVSTLKEVAAILGVARVSGKEVENGEYPQVSLIEDMEDIQEAIEERIAEEIGEDFVRDHVIVTTVGDAPTEDLTVDEDIEEPTVEEEVEEPKEVVEVDLGTIEVVDKEEQDIEYPEVGDFTEIKDLKKYIKKLSDEQLTEWVELEGIEYVPNDHQAINRMRQAMAINALHFPESVKRPSAKKRSKYADYSMEELVQMALDNDVIVRDSKGDERIERMYTIMALREAGLIG